METFRLGNFIIDLVDNPSETLSAADKDKVICESIPVARKAFQNEGVNESDIIIHAIEVSTAVYLKDSEGSLIGFSGFVPEKVKDRTIIYLKGAALLPNYQGRGLFGLLSTIGNLCEAERYDDPTSLLVGTRTQSPVVFYFMTERLGLYPQIDVPVPEYLRIVFETYAELVRTKHSNFQSKCGLTYDQDLLVIRRAYGGEDENGKEFGFCMYGDHIPWMNNNEKVNTFVKCNLDLNNGDAFLLLGPFMRKRNFDALRRVAYKLDPCFSPIVRRYSSDD